MHLRGSPNNWKSLPLHIRSSDSFATFQSRLKSHLFASAYHVWSLTRQRLRFDLRLLTLCIPTKLSCFLKAITDGRAHGAYLEGRTRKALAEVELHWRVAGGGNAEGALSDTTANGDRWPGLTWHAAARGEKNHPPTPTHPLTRKSVVGECRAPSSSRRSPYRSSVRPSVRGCSHNDSRVLLCASSQVGGSSVALR